MRGVRLVVPEDVLLGDCESQAVDPCRSDDRLDASSRDDGADYDGDTVLTHLNSSIHEQLDGFMCDIGPDTIRAIDEEVRAASVVLVWGTVGVCEWSCFQNGQRALVESVSKKETPQNLPVPLSLVIGDSTVEWFSRMSDADGERTEGSGDLVKARIVSYANRNPTLAHTLCLHESRNVLSRVLKRESTLDEWIFLKEPFVEKSASLDEEDD
jgi:hypothetical protein